jgi:ELWxxDGT repeat protein
MRKFIVALFFLISANSIYSQDISLNMLDICKYNNSDIKDFVIVGELVYFICDGNDNGRELWRSDGTTAGTYIVKDINIGEADAFDANSNMANVNGILYFRANNGTSGYELWKSDGTSSGTTMVKDIATGTANSNPYGFIGLNDKMIFASNDEINGIELWITDGTEANTMLLKDINPGDQGSSPNYFIFFNNKIYFSADQNATGNELWMTDGTAAGTIIQNDLIVGSATSVLNKTNMLVFNNELYFRARNSTTGFELWKTNGSVGNATLILDVNVGGPVGFYGDFLTSNDQNIFFDGVTQYNGKEIWKSNGSGVGTTILKDIYTGYEDGIGNNLQHAFINNILYFTAGNNATGIELWKSDGTSVGTTLVKNIYPGANSSDILFLTNIDDVLYFSARVDFVEDKNFLWKSDGTSAGTQLVKDVNLRGTNLGEKNKIFKLNNLIFFIGYSSQNGWELWKTDGTNESTSLFFDLNYSCSSNPTDFVQLNPTEILFTANSQLYKSNGSISGTNLVYRIPNGGIIDTYDYSKFIKLDNIILYKAFTQENNQELWKSDGTTAGTSLVKDIYPGVGVGLNENFGSDYAILNGVVYFTANNGTNGYELWRSDGTSLGTYMLKDLTTGSNGSNINSFCVFNNRVFFVYNSNQIWSTNGTESDTVLFYSSNIIKGLTRVLNNLYFFANYASDYDPHSLYVTNSSLSTPQYLGTWSGGLDSDITIRKVFNNEIYFVVQSPTGGKTIVKSNGTLSGTMYVKNDLSLIDIDNVVVCGNYLYFTNNPSGTIKQIWRTDGTDVGTFIIANTTTTVSQHIKSLKCFQENLFYFKGQSSNYPTVWETNGIDSLEHNLVVNNSQQFINLYGAYDMFPTDSKLYFCANNGYSGKELYNSEAIQLLSLNEINNEEETSDNNVKLFPNPSHSFVDISSKNEMESITIYGIDGKTIDSEILNSKNFRIDLNNYSKGVYIIKMVFEKGEITKKLVKY